MLLFNILLIKKNIYTLISSPCKDYISYTQKIHFENIYKSVTMGIVLIYIFIKRNFQEETYELYYKGRTRQ